MRRSLRLVEDVGTGVQAMAQMQAARDRRVARVALWLIGLSLTSLSLTLALGLSPSARALVGWSTAPPTAYALEQVVDVPADLYQGSDQTLIVFSSGTCSACARSATALAAIARQLRGSRTRFRMVMPAARSADQDAFAARLDLAEGESSRLDLTHLQVRVVPTLVLVDRGGHVTFVHEGMVGLPEAGKVLEAIESHGLSAEAVGSRGGV